MAGEDLGAWVRVADEDIRAVRNCLYGPDPAVYAATYHCQQAAEKLIKTLIAATGVHPPKIHDIAVLTKRLGDEHPLAEQVKPFKRYTVYGAAFRYPMGGFLESEVDEPTIDEVASWLAEIEAARGAVVRFLGIG